MASPVTEPKLSPGKPVIEKTLSLGNKIGYSFATFGESIGYDFYYLFFLFFLTDIVGISPGVAGTISLFAVMWDAVTDPWIGHLSDHSKNPKGKRRPFILKYSIPLGITVLLLFTNFGLSGTAQIIYFLLLNVLFWLFFTAVDIPYMVLGGEITRITSERLELRWMCSSFNYVGFAVAGYTLFVVAKFENVLGDPSKAWTATAAVFGAAIAISFLSSYFATKGKEPLHIEQTGKEEEVPKFLPSLIASLKIKPYRNMLWYTLFLMTGVMVYTTDQVYLFMYNLGATEFQISNIYLFYAIMVILISPLMAKLGEKFGNKNTLMLSIIIVSFGYAVYLFIPFTMVTVWGILLATAIGVAGFFVVSYAMVYDIADVAVLKTGINNEGMLLSMFSFMIKVATALGMWIVGVFLEFYKYDPEIEATQEVLNGIRNIGTIISGVVCVVSLFFIISYTLTNENVEKLRQMRRDKEAGKEIDMAFVNKLL